MDSLLRLAHTRPSLRPLLLPVLRLASNVHLEEALEELHEPLMGWVFYASVPDKKELFERYHALSPVHKQALAQAVSAAMKHARAIMYRRMKPGQSPERMGGQSLSLHNPRMGEVHAFEVAPSDILLHPGIPDTALASKAYGHEREAILKLDARPQYLGLVYTNERGDIPLPRAFLEKNASSPLRIVEQKGDQVHWEMDLGQDHFVHFTSSKRANEILASGKLLYHPPYKKFGIDKIGAISLVWGAYVPGVQTTHIQADKEGGLVAVVFKTDTKPETSFPEEVLWDRDVVLKQAKVLPVSMAVSLLQRAPLKGQVQGFGHWVTYR